MEKLEAKELGYRALANHDYKQALVSYYKFLSDAFIERLCDYGENVSRVLNWMAFLLFLFGPILFSSLGGIDWSKDLTQKYFTLSPWNKLWFLYFHYFLYTLDVFTTASFS